MNNSILLLLFLLLTFTRPSYSAEKIIALSDNDLLKVADSFRAQGEYYRAITEYKKLLILFPDSEKADYALFNMGMSYYHGEEYASASSAFYSLRDKYKNSKYVAPSHYFEGLSYRKQKKYEEAKIRFDTLIDFYPATEYAPLARTAKSIMAIDAGDISTSKKELESLIKDYSEDKQAERAKEALKLMGDYENMSKKSASLAGVMSAILPGSGYIYAGRYGDGVTAFIVNGLFISGTVIAINQHNYPTAYIVGAFGLPFYIGNIYGSANAARKWNLEIRKDQQGKIYTVLNFSF